MWQARGGWLSVERAHRSLAALFQYITSPVFLLVEDALLEITQPTTTVGVQIIAPPKSDPIQILAGALSPNMRGKYCVVFDNVGRSAQKSLELIESLVNNTR